MWQKKKVFLSRISPLLQFTVQLCSCAGMYGVREEVKGHQQQEGVGQRLLQLETDLCNYGFISFSGL